MIIKIKKQDNHMYRVFINDVLSKKLAGDWHDMDYFKACQFVMGNLNMGDTVLIDTDDALSAVNEVSAVRFSIHFTSLLAYQTETIEVLQKTLNRVLE